MKLIDNLDRKYRRYGIKNLMLYIVAITGLVYIMTYYDTSGTISRKIILDPSLVLQGEVWRLVTYIFIPPNTSPLFLAFVLYFYYLVGSSLENEWGTFRFNLYYFIGIIGTTLSVFITGSEGTAYYLNLSLFLAFAWIFPNYTLRIFFILPVKIKYLALLYLLYIGITIVFSPFDEKIAAIVPLLNYILFFGKDMIDLFKNRKSVYQRKRDFKAKTNTFKNEPYHKCTVCGITDQDDPYMQFRYCIGCNGHYGYCQEHLHNHEHIK